MAATARDSLSESTVLEKTGKPLAHWRRVLDEFDCAEKGHKATAKFLVDKHGLTHWWAQTITVDYERAKGIRVVGQRHDGQFVVNVTRTVAAPVERVWEAWADAATLSKWFTTKQSHEFVEGGPYENADGDKGVFKKIVKHDRLHFTWENEKHCPGSLVIVQFLPKGKDKTTVAITHEKLPNKAGVDEMREGWSWALDSLKSFLETGKPIPYEDWLAGRK